MSPGDFRDRLEAYCAATGGSVSSYGRTRLHNRSLPGSVEDSAHLVWLAADVVYDHDDPVAWRERMAERLGVTIVHEGDHDHVQGG